ncbi:hypothetical protein J4E05_18815 [Thalassospira sp. NFXS8]|uniref:hypothetical protein n=1 Tax=Thalassospira sp. NFXS8 TaxID=2819093 RepID=UPI0032DFFBCB
MSIIISIGVIFGLNFLSLNVASEDYLEAKFLKSGFSVLEKENIDAVNIGGSVGKALLFNDIGVNGLNLAYDGRDIFENEALLKIILKKSHNLKTVFLASGPLSMMMDNSDIFYLIRRSYYRILAPYRGWHPIEDDWSNLILGRLLPLARKDRWRGVFETISNKKKDVSVVGWNRKYNSPAPPAPPSVADSQERLRASNNSLTVLLSSLEENLYYDHDLPERAEAALIRICQAVTSVNIKLVIYTTPIADIHYEQRAPFLPDALVYWNGAIRKCSEMGVEVFRFDNDPGFHKAYRLFEDPVHLNVLGAHVFSQLLSQRLGNREKNFAK